MKAQDLKMKTPDELAKLLLEIRKDQFNMRFQRSQGTLENTAQIRKTRRLIARIKTFLKSPVSEETKAKAKAEAKVKQAAPKKAAPAKTKAAKEEKPAPQKTAAKKPAPKKAAAKKAEKKDK